RATRDGARSAVHLTKYDIDGSENSGNIGQHVAAAQKIHRLQMRKTRRTDFAFVWLVGAVSDEVDAELALGRFNGGINLAGWDVITLSVELEVMDKCFHRALHLLTLGRNDLVVVHHHPSLSGARAQVFATLLHKFRRLAHLFHAYKISIKAVTVLSDGNIEIEFGVAFVRLRFAQIPAAPEPRTITPEKPQFQASESLT